MGGNLTVIGCNTPTERGVFYSLTNGFADGSGTKVTTGGSFASTGAYTQAIVGLTASTVYYFKAFATSSSGTAYSTQGTFITLNDVATAGFRSASTGNWNTAATWEYNSTGSTWVAAPQVPGSGNSVTIKATHAVAVDADAATCTGLTIESTASLTINSSKALTVSGTLTNSAGNSGLVVKSGGSLIQNSAVSATVERDIAAWNNPTIDHGWHFLSSPVSAQTIAPNFTNATATNYDFYCWWEPTNQWVNFKNTTVAPTWNTANNSSANFLAGICYLVDYAATSTKQFTGTLNKDDLSMGGLTISTGANKGWHLLGNPFTSAIKWNDGHWTLNNIAAGAKIWSETNASYSDIAANGIIPALNGFMVQVTSGTGSLTIPIAARVHNTTAWYKSTESPFIVLVAHDLSGQTAQESVVRFDNQATTGFDSDFDSHFLAGYAPQFYSIAGEDQLSTNVLPEIGGTVQIPFSFIKNDGASFSIEAKTISDLFGPVLLNDLKTKATQDLTSNPVYSFTAEPGDNPNRFLLTFSHLGIGETSKDHPFNVFASGHSLFISDNTGKNQGNVYVYNMMGQLIASSELNGNATIKLNLNVPAGYYLVKVVTSDQAYSNKVFINQ